MLLMRQGKNETDIKQSNLPVLEVGLMWHKCSKADDNRVSNRSRSARRFIYH